MVKRVLEDSSREELQKKFHQGLETLYNQVQQSPVKTSLSYGKPMLLSQTEQARRVKKETQIDAIAHSHQKIATLYGGLKQALQSIQKDATKRKRLMDIKERYIEERKKTLKNAKDPSIETLKQAKNFKDSIHKVKKALGLIEQRIENQMDRFEGLTNELQKLKKILENQAKMATNRPVSIECKDGILLADKIFERSQQKMAELNGSFKELSQLRTQKNDKSDPSISMEVDTQP